MAMTERPIREPREGAGKPHLWHHRPLGLNNKLYECCRRCGVVRRADGKSDHKPCPGVVRITTRPAEEVSDA